MNLLKSATALVALAGLGTLVIPGHHGTAHAAGLRSAVPIITMERDWVVSLKTEDTPAGCLESVGGTVAIYHCDNTAAQHWILQPVAQTNERESGGALDQLENGNYYEILDSDDRLCLTPLGDAVQSGQLVFEPCSDRIEQAWRFVPRLDGSYFITSPYSVKWQSWFDEKCLGVVSSRDPTLQQGPCASGMALGWQIVPQVEWQRPGAAAWERLQCTLDPVTDHDKDKIPGAYEQCLARHYAPILVLHENNRFEKGWPGDADLFWTSSEKRGSGEKQFLDPPDHILSGVYPHSGGNRPPVYTHVYPNELGGISVQYWMFYPWNGTPLWHEGDWEHITIRLSRRLEMDGLTYYAHGEPSWTNRYRLELYRDEYGEHPVIYVAQQSHASYVSRPECDQGGTNIPVVYDGDSCPQARAIVWASYLTIMVPTPPRKM